MSKEKYDRLTFGIGIFHVYAHEYGCQVKYSPRSLEGLGRVDGEVCERSWSELRHLIPSCRTSSKYVRLQVLTHAAIDLSETRFLSMSKTMCQSLATAFVLVKEAEDALQLFAAQGIDIATIVEQSNRMTAHYSARQANFAVDINEDIFVLVLAYREAKKSLVELTKTGAKDDQTVEDSVKHLVAGRIGPEWTANTLRRKIEYLLERAKQGFEMWEKDNGEPGELFIEYKEKYRESEMRGVKHIIWEQQLNRNFETARLYGSLSGFFFSFEELIEKEQKHHRHLPKQSKLEIRESVTMLPNTINLPANYLPKESQSLSYLWKDLGNSCQMTNSGSWRGCM